MIFEVTEENKEELKNSFLSYEWIEEEKKNNPFAKFLVLKEQDEIIGYIYYSDIYERAEINQFEIKSIHRNCGKNLCSTQNRLIWSLFKKKSKTNDSKIILRQFLRSS